MERAFNPGSRRKLLLSTAALGLLLAACSGHGATSEADSKIAESVVTAAADLDAGRPLDDHLARIDAEGRLEIYVYVTGEPEDPTSALSSNGLEGIVFRKAMGLAQGWVKPVDLKGLAALPFVKRITLPQYALPR